MTWADAEVTADAPNPVAEPVRSLTGCTGTFCRSPCAAVVLREGLRQFGR